MECTKGKIYVTEDYYGGLRISIVPTNATNIDGSGSIFENTGRGAGDISEANAEEIVRRWNAFEEGGLVDDVCNQLMDLYDSCSYATSPEIYGTILGLHEKLEAALAKS